MAKTVTLLPLLLLLLLFVASSLTEGVYNEQDAYGHNLKRSLCNTFGGCSSTTKRSLRQQQQLDNDKITLVDQLRQPMEGGNVIKRDNSNDNFYTKRIEEILADLFEYMENNEKYRQDAGSADLQELQILKRDD